MIEVLRQGPLTTVQDLGRPGYAHLGVPPSGAADAWSLRLANRLVGNPEGAAGLEMTLGGLAARFRDPAWIALTGAPAEVHADRRPVDMDAPVRVGPGEVVTIGAPSRGVRTYLAVRGGIDVPPVLDSRSTDLLSGLGPRPLEPGAGLAVGPAAGLASIGVDLAPPREIPEDPVLRVVPGPRADWLAEDALTTLTGTTYTVSTASNRVGLRLDGPHVESDRAEQLPSEGLVTGALQVPPSGQPILFLTDHPTTGGYPVLAVVVRADLGAAGQLRPGTRVRFSLHAQGGRSVRSS
ncbi:MAG: biotin-dependent carboxyltransferase family protein [Streptosporangiaceae bacterium]